MNNKKNHKYDLEFDNLAIPEIHTGQKKKEESKEPQSSITYDTVAIPEIHIKHKN